MALNREIVKAAYDRMNDFLALLRDQALPVCRRQRHFLNLLRSRSGRRYGLDSGRLERYIAMVNTVRAGRHLLPYRYAETARARGYESLWQNVCIQGRDLRIGSLIFAPVHARDLRVLFDAWWSADPEAARSSLQAIIEADTITRVVFDDRRRVWGLSMPSADRPSYVLFASTRWGLSDPANGAFVTRDMALAHEVQHRFIDPDIHLRLKQPARLLGFDTYHDATEFVAMSYEATLARRHGLVPRATHRTGHVVAAADPGHCGLQLPYDRDGTAAVLVAGCSIRGRLIALDTTRAILHTVDGERITLLRERFPNLWLRQEPLDVSVSLEILADSFRIYTDGTVLHYLRLPAAHATIRTITRH